MKMDFPWTISETPRRGRGVFIMEGERYNEQGEHDEHMEIKSREEPPG